MEQQVTESTTKKTEEIQQPNVVLTPGKMRVIKRNGKVVSFEEEKIKVATLIFSSSNDTTFPLRLITRIFPGVRTTFGC